MTTSPPVAPTPSPPPSDSSVNKTFQVPDYLQTPGIGVTDIFLDQRCLIFKYKASENMKGDIRVLLTGKWDTDLYQLKDRAARKGFSAENIELLVKGFGHIYSGEAADNIAQIRDWAIEETESKKVVKAANTDEEKKPRVIKHYVQKYRDPSNGLELYEAILVGRNAHFISIDRDAKTQEGHIAWRLTPGFRISNTAANEITEILPKEHLSYTSKPYQFESEKEIQYHLQKASNLTLDRLYTDVKTVAKKYIAASDTHHIIIAGDVIFTYFQDIFGQTHYLYFYGDNGTGKTINLQLLSLLAYRAMYDVDITAANIFTYYGTLEEGQGVILEDEADDLDYKQQEKMKIYKKGYNAGGKVSRTETGGSDGRVQEGYYVYGFKAFTGEERLDPDYAKGFNERTFYIKCESGDPEYDLSEVTSPAGAEEFEQLRQELEDMHKTLLMYRLIHHTDKFPNVDVAVKNREKQLTKPLIRLFQGTQSLKEIAEALGKLIAERRGVKKETIEYAIYKTIEKLIAERKTYEFSAKLVYTTLREELDGEYKDENKDQSFETPIHGKVSHKRISQICEDRFGADIKHTSNGNVLVFNEERFEKVKATYSLEDSGVQIIKEQQEVKDVKHVKDSSSAGVGIEEKVTKEEDEIRTENEEILEESEEIDEEDAEIAEEDD
jgi:hypothetical protein